MVLFVGRAFQRKGGDLLVAAFRRLREDIPNARLVIVGPDPIGLGRGFEEVGFIDKDAPGGEERLRDIYRTATVYCLPTHYEPFGISFVEAMSHGLPCVGPRSWAVPEIIEDEVTGLLVEPDNEVALAGALARLCRDREAASRMGRAGYERYRQRFTWDRVASLMVEAMCAEPYLSVSPP